MSKKFIKVIEDFICLNCGAQVKGNGYTNHCPYCLWSKHVDVFPGDRNEECMGLMKPVGIVKKKKEYSITFQCVKCGQENINKCSGEDDLVIFLKSHNE